MDGITSPIGNIVNSLVNAGKIRQVPASSFLGHMNEHRLLLEDLQFTPEELLVEYLSQGVFQFSIVEKIHLSVAIKAHHKVNNHKQPKSAESTYRRKSGKERKVSTKTSVAPNTKSPRKEKILSAGRSEKKSKKITDHYDITDLIGRGGFSHVRKGKNKKTNEIVAVKIIEKRQNDPDKLTKVKNEIELMQKLNHKNIVCLKEVFEEDTEEGRIFMVMEYVSGGELFDHIVNRGHYSEHDAALVIRQIIEAVSYLHTNNIAHRDLKPENLLCTGVNNEIIKVADFGLSKEFDDSMETMCGTPDYVAPEVLRGNGYTNAVDIWSIGVVTYVMLCGSPPFYGSDDKEVFLKILQADYKFFSPEWDSISQEAKDFISVLLVLDPHLRPTALQCLDAPWIKNSEPASKHLVTEAFSANIKSHTNRRRTKNTKK